MSDPSCQTLSDLAARRERHLPLTVWRARWTRPKSAAFQFRVKGLAEHDAARLAEPLQRICAGRDVAFIVNDFGGPRQAAWRGWGASRAG